MKFMLRCSEPSCVFRAAYFQDEAVAVMVGMAHKARNEGHIVDVLPTNPESDNPFTKDAPGASKGGAP